MATITIGDVHGNLAALNDMLNLIRPHFCDEDTVVFLGDYIDRGPDSRGCIDKILNFRNSTKAKVVTLLGNHEEWLLRTYQDYSRHSWILGMGGLGTIRSYSAKASSRLKNEFAEMGTQIIENNAPLPYEIFFDAMPREHIDFFLELKSFHRTPECICVHGGLNPNGGSPEEQPLENLVWGTDGFPDRYMGRDKIVYGHADDSVLDDTGWPSPRIIHSTYGIDTISKGVLTALKLPEESIIQSSRFI